MIIEWLGGPQDGQLFEAPDGMDHITIALFVAANLDNGDHTELFPVHKVRDIRIEQYADGRYFVRYPME